MKIILHTLILLFIVACNSQPELKQPEQESDSIDLNNPGEFISTVEFQVRANKEELKDFEDGVIPWISIENTEAEIDRLIDADEVVVPYSEITYLVDYPLNKPATFVMKSPGKGFTRKQLVNEISKAYHEIYGVEERSAKTKTIPLEKRKGLINRNETDGDYGVWGHDIGDLDLSSVEIYKSVNGKIVILLVVES